MEPQETPTPIHQEPSIENTKKPGISIPAAIITGAAMIALALVIVLHPGSTGSTNTNGSTAPTTPTSVPKDIVTIRSEDSAHIRGNISTAQVLIFEYSDSDCPFCEQFHPTLQKIVNDYQGRVAWVYRYFPLDIHPDSHNEAIALECVGKLGGATAFNTFLDSIVNVTLTPNNQTMKTLSSFAAQAGVNTSAFTSCVADPSIAQTVDASSQEAQVIGAQGTPFSIAVNIKTGKQIIIPGAYPYDQVKKDIDSLL